MYFVPKSLDKVGRPLRSYDHQLMMSGYVRDIMTCIYYNVFYISHFSDDNEIKLSTPSRTSEGKVILRLRWAGAYDRNSNNVDFARNFTFEYRPDPNVTNMKPMNAFKR